MENCSADSLSALQVWFPTIASLLVLAESFARKYFGGDGAVGKIMEVGKGNAK